MQGEMLALLLVGGERRWTVEELAERTGHPYQTVATEVRRWETTGIVAVERVGRTKLLTVNRANPYVRPLTDLVTIAFGPPLVIAEEFGKVAGIERLFIYGSWAARFEGEPGATPNDVDVMVVGSPDRDEVFDAAGCAERRLGQQVNVTQRTVDAWETGTDGFTQHVRSSPLVEVPYPHGRAEVEQGK